MIVETIIAITLLTTNQMENVEKHFPTNETSIILEVANEYQLTQEETILLFAIRRVENSGMLRINEHGEHISGNANGMQFGVGHGIKGHPSKRYAGNFEKSLRLQAQWTAGTIDKRYKGNLNKFASRWCPDNKDNWERLITFWVNKLE